VTYFASVLARPCSNTNTNDINNNNENHNIQNGLILATMYIHSRTHIPNTQHCLQYCIHTTALTAPTTAIFLPSSHATAPRLKPLGMHLAPLHSMQCSSLGDIIPTLGEQKGHSTLPPFSLRVIHWPRQFVSTLPIILQQILHANCCTDIGGGCLDIGRLLTLLLGSDLCQDHFWTLGDETANSYHSKLYGMYAILLAILKIHSLSTENIVLAFYKMGLSTNFNTPMSPYPAWQIGRPPPCMHWTSPVYPYENRFPYQRASGWILHLWQSFPWFGQLNTKISKQHLLLWDPTQYPQHPLLVKTGPMEFLGK